MADNENDAQSHPWNDENIVEIFAAGSNVEADRVRLLLEEEGIEAERKETSVPQFPGAGSHRHLILVLAHDREKAVATIKQAIADKILPDDGAFL